MKIQHLDTHSYSGVNVARETEGYKENKFEKYKTKSTVLFNIPGQRLTSTFSTLPAPPVRIIEALDAVSLPSKLFIHTLCIQGPIVEPVYQLPLSQKKIAS